MKTEAFLLFTINQDQKSLSLSVDEVEIHYEFSFYLRSSSGLLA